MMEVSRLKKQKTEPVKQEMIVQFSKAEWEYFSQN